MLEFILAILSAMLINNIVLVQFLGICPLVGVSKKTSSAVGMGLAVTVVLVLASLITWPITYFILQPAEISFMNIIVFVLIIATIVQIVELILKKYSTPLYKSLGIYLPLIATNCAIIGVVQTNANLNNSFATSMSIAIGTGLGFALVLIIFSTIRVRLDSADVPKAFKGVPIALVVVAIMAMAFAGFSGMIS